MKLKDVFKRFFDINSYEKKVLKKSVKGKWKYNVTGTKDRKQHAKEFSNVHFILKNRVIYPILWFINKFEKYQVKVDKQPHHVNLRILNKAIDKGSEECFKHYTCLEGKRLDNPSYKLVDSIKKWILTLAMKDHWICEMVNMIMYNIVIEMNKEYQNCKQHLIYSANHIDDMEYFKIQDVLIKKRELKRVK